MFWWFFSFETQSQSRIPPVKSYRRKNRVLVAEVTASSDSKLSTDPRTNVP